MKTILFSKLRETRVIVALCVLSMFLVTTAFTFQGKQDFTLVNASGVEIHNLYISPHSANDWGEDVLGKDTLANGESTEITFHPRENIARWDLQVTDSKGNALEWENLNLTKISKVTIHYRDGKGWADLE